MTMPADQAADHRIPDLPDDVALVSGLAEGDARQIVADLAVHYGWAYTLRDHAAATTVLREYRRPAEDEVTADERRRVTRTPAWTENTNPACDAVITRETILRSFFQAGLECWTCSRRLTGPPTVTGRLCDEHRFGPDRQPAVVDPVTEGLYWMSGRTLFYGAPRASDNAPSRDAGVVVDFAELDQPAAARASAALGRLDGLPTVVAEDWVPATPSTGWICVCGNRTHRTPFRPCDQAGRQVDQASPRWWLCPPCGRIIDPSGAVAGRANQDVVNLGGRPAPWPGVGYGTAGIGKVSLHLPTGAAGLVGVRPHHDGGPIADRSTRLLEPVTPVPLPDGHPYAQRTTDDVDAVLREVGWQVISRAEAARRLRATGYHLGTSRAAGHLLYADDADEITWRTDFTGYCMEAFAAPIEPPAAPGAP